MVRVQAETGEPETLVLQIVFHQYINLRRRGLKEALRIQVLELDLPVIEVGLNKYLLRGQDFENSVDVVLRLWQSQSLELDRIKAMLTDQCVFVVEKPHRVGPLVQDLGIYKFTVFVAHPPDANVYEGIRVSGQAFSLFVQSNRRFLMPIKRNMSNL